jgi:hypothetical protein
MFWGKKRTTIKAVDDQDFPDFLRRIGALKMIEKGEAKCKVCGDTLTVNQIEVVLPEDGRVTFICGKPKCMTASTQRSNNANK